MRLLHDLAKTHATFDDPNLVSRAGLVLVMALAQRAGITANPAIGSVRSRSSGDSPASTTSPLYRPALHGETQVTTRIIFPSPTR